LRGGLKRKNGGEGACNSIGCEPSSGSRHTNEDASPTCDARQFPFLLYLLLVSPPCETSAVPFSLFTSFMFFSFKAPRYLLSNPLIPSKIFPVSPPKTVFLKRNLKIFKKTIDPSPDSRMFVLTPKWGRWCSLRLQFRPRR